MMAMPPIRRATRSPAGARRSAVTAAVTRAIGRRSRRKRSRLPRARSRASPSPDRGSGEGLRRDSPPPAPGRRCSPRRCRRPGRHVRGEIPARVFCHGNIRRQRGGNFASGCREQHVDVERRPRPVNGRGRTTCASVTASEKKRTRGRIPRPHRSSAYPVSVLSDTAGRRPRATCSSSSATSPCCPLGGYGCSPDIRA